MGATPAGQQAVTAIVRGILVPEWRPSGVYTPRAARLLLPIRARVERDPERPVAPPPAATDVVQWGRASSASKNRAARPHAKHNNGGLDPSEECG